MQLSQSFVYFYPYCSRKMTIKITVFHLPVLIHIMKKTRFFTVFFTPQGFTYKKRSILQTKTRKLSYVYQCKSENMHFEGPKSALYLHKVEKKRKNHF